MGKSQKKRSMRRHNPVRVPDSHLPKGVASSSNSGKTENVLPILQKMESPEAAERKWSCVAVSNLIQNDPSTRRLLQGKNVVGALINRLTDSEEEVVVEAAGALRNLCIDGGYDICAEMYNKNILSPLKNFVHKITATLSQLLEPSAPASSGILKTAYEFAENVITVLWCLSETSNKALNAINQMNLVPFLMSFLASRENIPLSTVMAAAHCLYVLTDDNQPAIDDLKSNAAYISYLFNIARTELTMSSIAKGAAQERLETCRVLACGILHNLSPLPPPAAASSVDIDQELVLPLLLPLISSVSLADISKIVEDAISKQSPDLNIENLSLKNTPKSDHKTELELLLDRTEIKLRMIQLSLEVLTGICATLPDPEPNTDALIEDEDDWENASNVDMAVDQATVEIPYLKGDLIQALVNPLLQLIQPQPLSFPPLGKPSPHPPTTSALSAIHVCALECLNNVFLSLARSGSLMESLSEDDGRRVWNEIWVTLGLVGLQFGPGQEFRQQMWEVGTGVLWGIGILWKGHLVPVDEHVKVLIQLCDTTTDPKFRVKCIGALECLAQHPASIEANKLISDTFLAILPTADAPSQAGTEPLIQAVSALIDIYSDEDMLYDVNFRTGSYLKRLAASVDGFRKAVKAIDKRKEGGKQLRLRGEEVYENLVAFIDYRRNLVCSR